MSHMERNPPEVFNQPDSSMTQTSLEHFDMNVGLQHVDSRIVTNSVMSFCWFYHVVALFSYIKAAEEIRCIFDDNSKIIFVKSSKNLCCGCSLESPRQVIQMSTHNMGFYEEISKVIT